MKRKRTAKVLPWNHAIVRGFSPACGGHTIWMVLFLLSVFLILYTISPAVYPKESFNTVSVDDRVSDGWKLVGVAQENRLARLAVIYPEIGEPYRSIFDSIIKGIGDSTNWEILRYAISREVDVSSLDKEFARRKIKLVVALGRNGLKVATTLSSKVRVIAGGVIWAPQEETKPISVVSLAPDPDLLFSNLLRLKPGIKRVFIVYNPEQNEWLLKLASVAATKNDITLVSLPADSLKVAVSQYKKVLDDIEPSRDAIWLPQDSTTVNSSAILPLVLEQAWRRSIAIFSSSVVHVRRGALFSLYPDNRAMGHQIGALVKKVSNGKVPHGGAVLPLVNVLTALNIRTANHLGIDISYRDQRTFDLIFPQH